MSLEPWIPRLVLLLIVATLLPRVWRTDRELRHLLAYSAPRATDEVWRFVLGDDAPPAASCARVRATFGGIESHRPYDMVCWLPCESEAAMALTPRFGVDASAWCSDPRYASVTDRQRWPKLDGDVYAARRRARPSDRRIAEQVELTLPHHYADWTAQDEVRRRFAPPTQPPTDEPYRWVIWHDEQTLYVMATPIIPSGWGFWGC